MHLPTPMTLRWQLTLQPGASQTVAASFGTTIPTAPGEPEQAAAALYAEGLHLHGAQIPDWLSRELQWHAGQIRQSTMYDGATGNQVIGQGSAYLGNRKTNGVSNSTPLGTQDAFRCVTTARCAWTDGTVGVQGAR